MSDINKMVWLFLELDMNALASQQQLDAANMSIHKASNPVSQQNLAPSKPNFNSAPTSGPIKPTGNNILPGMPGSGPNDRKFNIPTSASMLTGVSGSERVKANELTAADKVYQTQNTFGSVDRIPTSQSTTPVHDTISNQQDIARAAAQPEYAAANEENQRIRNASKDRWAGNTVGAGESAFDKPQTSSNAFAGTGLTPAQPQFNVEKSIPKPADQNTGMQEMVDAKSAKLSSAKPDSLGSEV